jgi:hypothetical protein
MGMKGDRGCPERIPRIQCAIIGAIALDGRVLYSLNERRPMWRAARILEVYRDFRPGKTFAKAGSSVAQ